MKSSKKISVFLLFVATCFSATNDTTIDSATLKRIYMGNYSYNTCISSQPILTMRWASDLNRPVFKNRTGTLYKALMDASTTSNTPQYRVFFADANGLASSSSAFVYTNGNLHSDYFSGDSIIVTGKVKAATGVYSGELQSTTLNTGYGNNELYPMDQPVRTTDAVNFDSIVLSKGLKLGTNVSGPTSTPYRIDMGNTYSNGVTADKCKLYLYHDKASSQYYGIGIGGAGDIQYHSKISHNYYIDDVEKIRINSSGATVIGSLTSNTLNTGNGDNKLYEMDQNVKSTDSINGLVFKASRIRTPLLLSDSIVNSTGISTKRFIARSGTHGDPANSGTSQPYLISRFIGNDFGVLDIGEYSSGGSYWIQVCDALSLGTSYSFCINPNGGNIGINKKNPQYPLDVTGEGRFTAGINASDLRVSDSVKAVNAAFSGRTTTTSLQASDTIKSAYGKYTNDLIIDGIRFPCTTSVPYIYRDSINNNILIGTKYTSPYIQDAGIVFSAFTNDSTLMTRNDTVKVKKFVATSINTDTLKINNKKMDFDSGSFSITAYGLNPTVNGTCNYTNNNGVITVRFPANFGGTSNSQNFYFASLPSSIRPLKFTVTTASSQFTEGTSSTFQNIPISIDTDGLVALRKTWLSTQEKMIVFSFTFTYRLQ